MAYKTEVSDYYEIISLIGNKGLKHCTKNEETLMENFIFCAVKIGSSFSSWCDINTCVPQGSIG